MRWDEIGLFWQDIKQVREAKEKIVRVAPDPIWLNDDYLPHLETAKQFQLDEMTDAELMSAKAQKHSLVWDTEFYSNYALIGFQSTETKKFITFVYDENSTPNYLKLKWILDNFLLIGFNDTKFDLPMAAAVLAGNEPPILMELVHSLIYQSGPGFSGMQEFYKNARAQRIKANNIDLIELTPLRPSLKVCAGRMHSPLMQDLPFEPGRTLTEDQKTILLWYWANDIQNTFLLYEKLKPAIELRKILSDEYKVDVRSKSDPQIAESVIRSEMRRLTGVKYFKRAEIQPGRRFKFRAAPYVHFQTPLMQSVLNLIHDQFFTIGNGGEPVMPDALKALTIPIAGTVYKMGIGGLHSQEKRMIHKSDDEYELTDNDVTSYYPALIIQQGMYPPQIGPVFLEVFKKLYHKRLAAKSAGDKGTAETLKIVINGTFGKTGERGGWSVVYYPEMMIQVTLSGQLALLMLIERLELAGITVVSANTDGIVIKCPRPLVDEKKAIIAQWERETELNMETSEYAAIYSRDVNNYIAVYANADKDAPPFKRVKAIGTYRETLSAPQLKWNPTGDIVAEAVILWLLDKKPLSETIRECDDFRKFVTVRMVRGGAVKDGDYLGKAIRWYYSSEVEDEIVNASNGHFVPKSKGARPCMTLPDAMPQDIDFDRYEQEAEKMIEDLFPKPV